MNENTLEKKYVKGFSFFALKKTCAFFYNNKYFIKKKSIISLC